MELEIQFLAFGFLKTMPKIADSKIRLENWKLLSPFQQFLESGMTPKLLFNL